MKRKSAILALTLCLILGTGGYAGEIRAEEAAETQNTEEESSGDEVLEKARTMYAQYDYDAAIIYLKEQENFPVQQQSLLSPFFSLSDISLFR